VAGRLLMREGRLVTLDEVRLLAEADIAAERLDRLGAAGRAGAEAAARLAQAFCLGRCTRHAPEEP
jgi:hypothetical protein